MVALAQLAEHRIVAPKVTGSSPVGHPNITAVVDRNAARLIIAALAFAATTATVDKWRVRPQSCG